MLRRMRVWLRALLRRSAVEREMQEEMRLHLDLATERLLARGMSAEEAHAAALREFGNLGVIREESRDARGVRWIEEALQDLRFGVRSLIKTPAFSIVSVLSLVLGIGVNSAIFTILKTALQPGTIAEPATFLYLPATWSKPAYDYVRGSTPALASLFARSTEVVLLAPRGSGDEPRRATVELVSENFFTSLHAPLTLGRGFGRDDARSPGREPVAVLNYRFWRSRFDADSNVLGKTIRLATGATFTVIGVAGRDFTGVRRGGPDFWLPYTLRSTLPAVYQLDPGRSDWLTDNRLGWLSLYGRLAPGHDVGEARGQIELALRKLAAVDSSFAPGLPREALRIETGEGGGINGRAERLAASAILAATLIVLLVACFNVASLMLARGADRQREIAIRLCLGAGRGRVVRQLVMESAIIAVAGGVAGMLISAAVLRAVVASGALAVISNEDPDRLMRLLTPDAWVLSFALAMSIASVMVFGLVPALRATRPDLASAVKLDSSVSGKPARTRLRHSLVVAQVALSLVLLVCAGVLLRSLVRALALDVGFARARVLAVQTSLRLSGYDSAGEEAFGQTLEERLMVLAGVRSVARGNLPVVFRSSATLTTRRAGAATVASFPGHFLGVTPSFFSTIGIPIVRGRAFDEDELRASAQVAVISETTARTLWGSDDPIGQVVKIAPGGKAALLSPEALLPSAVVVGVARDAQMVELGRVPAIFAYVPSKNGVLLVSADGPTESVAQAIRALARGIDHNALVSVSTLDDAIESRSSIPAVRLAGIFAGAVGALALILASIGVFGLVAYSVSQRTRELGIRMALGAHAAEVVAMIMRQGLGTVGTGALIGVVAGAICARLLAAQLFGMSPLDPMSYAAVIGVVGAVALLACYLPARRASRVDPLLALRTE